METDVGAPVLREETFEIYQALTNEAESPLQFKNHQDQVTDIISDTDPDYIPNSDEEFSDKDITTRSRKLVCVRNNKCCGCYV